MYLKFNLSTNQVKPTYKYVECNSNILNKSPFSNENNRYLVFIRFIVFQVFLKKYYHVSKISKIYHQMAVPQNAH